MFLAPLTLAGLITASGGGLSLPHLEAPEIEYIVDLKDDLTEQDVESLEDLIHGDLKLNSIHSEDERMYLLQVPASRAQEVLQTLKADPRVEIVESNLSFNLIEPVVPQLQQAGPVEKRTEITKGPRQPNDPQWSKQWSFRMVNAPAAWTLSEGKGAIVAVIDTGVAFEDHKKFVRVEDLNQTGFVTGYDFVHDTDHPNDDHGHGTHVAGTIAQSTNNGVGVAGLAPKARIMPLKVLSARGSGTAADISDAIRFAADEGAHVINMSLGGGMRSFVMQKAVAYARKKGVVVICAAGNNARNKVEFPAAYPGSFAVSSVGPTGKLAYYSSYGKELQISAPGGDKNIGGDEGGILQNTVAPGRIAESGLYLSFQGTSMATPHVAGVAALIIGVGVKDPSAIEEILRVTAKDAGPPGRDIKYGHGILDAAAAVKAAHTYATTMASHYDTFDRRGAYCGNSASSDFTNGLGAIGILMFIMGLLATYAAEMRGGGRRYIPGLALLAGAVAVFGMAIHSMDMMQPMLSVNGLVFSVLPAVALTVLVLRVRLLWIPLTTLLGLWCACLGLMAWAPVNVEWIAGYGGWLDRLWLASQAVLTAAFLIRVANTLQRLNANKNKSSS